MAKRRTSDNQLQKLPEYGELISIMQSETASILTDYVRQYVGALSKGRPGEAVFINFDRVGSTQSYQELAWFDLYAEVERDPHVKAVLDSSKINVAGLPWDISPYTEEGSKTATERNKAIASFVKKALTNAGHLPQHLYNLMGALGMGFAVSEIVWDITDDGIVPKSILNRPPRRFQFDAVDRSLKLRSQGNPYFGVELPEKKFIVHRCSSQWENPFGDAVDQSLYWMWLFKRTVQKFWMHHLQVGASSVPIVKHPANASATLKSEALVIAQMIRNGAYGRLPDNFEILWAEAKNAIQNADTYEKFNQMCDDQISKAVNGQTLTTEAGKGKTGTYAQGKVHEDTQVSRDLFRAHGLEASLNASIVKWLTDFNFSGIDGYPQFRFDLEDPEDLAKESEIIKTLSDAGYEFDEKELTEKFNYTIKRKEALKLTPVAEPPPPEKEPEKDTKEIVEEFAEKIESRSERLIDRITALFSGNNKGSHIEVRTPDVHVDAPITVNPPEINVQTPAVKFSAPPVTVNQAPIQIDVHLPNNRGKFSVIRDKDGNIQTINKE